MNMIQTFKIFRAFETLRLFFLLSFRRLKLFFMSLKNSFNHPVKKVNLLDSAYADGLVIKISLNPREEKNETERAVLALLCGGIKRHIHIDDAENYRIILNWSFCPVHGGWVGRGAIKPWHEIPKAFGLRVIYAIKKKSAD